MKRLISIILILMCVLSQNVFAAELSDEVKADLYTLGIMQGDEGGNLNLENNITRAEAAKMICVAGGLNTEFENSDNVFNDVDVSHWAYKYIRAVTEEELMAGDEAGCFNPEGNITNEEIVTIIIRLLGYEARALVFGGGTAGCVVEAKNLGITEDIQFGVNAPATRDDVAIILYRALDIPLMEKSHIEGGIVFKILDGENGDELKTLRGKIAD